MTRLEERSAEEEKEREENEERRWRGMERRRKKMRRSRGSGGCKDRVGAKISGYCPVKEDWLGGRVQKQTDRHR